MKEVIYKPINVAENAFDFSTYPRPQMARDSYLCLNGDWNFEADFSSEEPKNYTQNIRVPFAPESSLSGIAKTPDHGEYLHYRKAFSLPAGFVKDRVLLHFGAVDQIAKVYLNGSYLGENIGGYHPFSFDVTKYLTEENILTVCVQDDCLEYLPYGKQTKKRGGMWYTPVSGIWQTVWLESVPKNYIKGLKITQSLSSVTIEVESEAKEKKLFLKETGETFAFGGNSITITPENPKRWSPERPFLYEFTLCADEDKVESYFALREINVQTVNGIPRICLNGKPYFIQALLDQGYYPGGLFLPSSEEGYEKDILIAKKMGYNTLRKHIKVEPMIFYHLCDRLGMIVFQDMVNCGHYSFLKDTALPTIGLKRRNDEKLHKDAKVRKAFEDSMRKTIAHLYSTPSVLLYTIFNEGWGQFCAEKMFNIAKNIDPTRIYDATSGWFWQNESDLDSLHVYFKPLKKQSKSSRPLLISEFGGYSLRVKDHVTSEKNYGYKSFADEKTLQEALRELYIKQALPLVKEGLCGLVYTQIADVEDETNGLLTYDREIQKVDADQMKEILSSFESAYESIL